MFQKPIGFTLMLVARVCSLASYGFWNLCGNTPNRYDKREFRKHLSQHTRKGPLDKMLRRIGDYVAVEYCIIATDLQRGHLAAFCGSFAPQFLQTEMVLSTLK
jgi:hypothetical protein